VKWSLDGRRWRAMPWGEGRFSDERFWSEIALGAKERQWVSRLLRTGEESEPIAHLLYREAFEERYENPRSALIIGMAALEVGLKRCLADRGPDARWLVESSPRASTDSAGRAPLAGCT
jgi:hypothetical protein